MIQSIIELYCIYFDNQNNDIFILSLDNDKLTLPSIEVNPKSSISELLNILIEDVSRLSAQYYKFIHMEPRISDSKLILSYCVVIPHNTEINTDKYYEISTKQYAYNSEILRKIINFV
jgi:hypothetical protein